MVENSTSLPAEGNVQSHAFAQQLRAQVDSDREYVNAVLDHIRNEEFYYTLSPSLLGENSIDDFLFNTHEGFCEHYASAFTFLMRSVGIPSRVVLGYQGGEFNKYNETLIVRQYDAHGWKEKAGYILILLLPWHQAGLSLVVSLLYRKMKVFWMMRCFLY